MPKICFTINHVRHCFDIPLLVDTSVIHRPPPPNFPELELALSVVELVNFLKPVMKDQQLGRSLTEVSTQFIQQVQKDLPKGVELTELTAAKAV